MYLGLGSNVGDRHANLLKLYKGLREVNTTYSSQSTQTHRSSCVTV